PAAPPKADRPGTPAGAPEPPSETLTRAQPSTAELAQAVAPAAAASLANVEAQRSLGPEEKAPKAANIQRPTERTSQNQLTALAGQTQSAESQPPPVARTRQTQTVGDSPKPALAQAVAPSDAEALPAAVRAPVPPPVQLRAESAPVSPSPPTDRSRDAAHATAVRAPEHASRTEIVMKESPSSDDAVHLYLAAEDARFRGQYVGAIALFERAIEASGPSPVAVQAHLRIAEIAAGPLNDTVRARIAYEACLAPALRTHVSAETRAAVEARLAALH
ncbi:MAG: hypothetical protein N2111_13195, partial [Candidatus Sumerlaeaceae bacterium]|nr:hypothetical protein [Candidatus Sumerlaeaceae bacterium]